MCCYPKVKLQGGFSRLGLLALNTVDDVGTGVHALLVEECVQSRYCTPLSDSALQHHGHCFSSSPLGFYQPALSMAQTTHAGKHFYWNSKLLFNWQEKLSKNILCAFYNLLPTFKGIVPEVIDQLVIKKTKTVWQLWIEVDPLYAL